LSVPRFVCNVASMLCRSTPGFAERLSALPDVSKLLEMKECQRNPKLAFQIGVLQQLRELPMPASTVNELSLLVVDSLDESRLTDDKLSVAQLLADPRVLE